MSMYRSMQLVRVSVMSAACAAARVAGDYLRGNGRRRARPLPCTFVSTAVASSASPSVGELLRDWRQRRRLSQLDLSLEASVSARHLSFVETGRSKPSRELLLHLA